VWSLSGDEARRWVDRLTGLPRAEPAQFQSNLGYRGLTASVTSDAERSIVRIQNGKVHVVRGRTDHYYSDPERALERSLLRTGEPFVDRAVYEAIEQQMATGQPPPRTSPPDTPRAPDASGDDPPG
jgi:hypothetical protein